MNRKTLILLSPAFPANESAGESVWLPAKQRLVKCINRLYPETEIIILSFRFPLKKNDYYWHGNMVIPFGAGNHGKSKSWATYFKVFKTLRNLRKEKNIIGILSFWCTECAFVGHYFSRLYNIKHFCWISGMDALNENKFVRRICPSGNELVAMSDFLQETFYANHHIRPAHLIPNGIDTREYTLQNMHRKWDIMGAGSLSSIKRYDLFVKIAARLKEFFPDIQICLCGNGPEKEKIEKQIKALRLENNITLAGEIPTAEVFHLMQQTKVFLHTSSYEGFGNVCIEALYAGAKVVSFVRPMKQPVPDWYIAGSEDGVTKIIKALLSSKSMVYNSGKPLDMEDSAHKFMKLFLEQ